MELQKFIESFLPNYEQKLTQAKMEYDDNVDWIIDGNDLFNRFNFSDALQNFANKLCEKQRIMCVNKHSIANTNVCIIETKTPNIDELC